MGDPIKAIKQAGDSILQAGHDLIQSAGNAGHDLIKQAGDGVGGLLAGNMAGALDNNVKANQDANRLSRAKNLVTSITDPNSAIDQVTQEEIFQSIGGRTRASAGDFTGLTDEQLSAMETKYAAARDKTDPIYKSRFNLQERMNLIKDAPTSNTILTDRSTLMQGSQGTLLTGMKQ